MAMMNRANSWRGANVLTPLLDDEFSSEVENPY